VTRLEALRRGERMSIAYLDPKQPLDIAPLADRNVERITEHCLDVNAKGAYIVKGRGGGAWWMIWMTNGMFILSLFSFIYLTLETGLTLSDPKFTNGVFELVFFVGMPTFIFFAVSLYVWPIRVWRNHIPIRFNRATRKVYFHWKGTTYIEDWDTLRAYFKMQAGLSGVGAPIRDPQINLEFHDAQGNAFTVFVVGTERLGLTDEEQAATFWEYIRRYMEEGPQSVPAPDLDVWNPAQKSELLKLHWPFPVLRSTSWWWWPLDLLLWFPLRVIWFLITYPTEVLYYHLAKRMAVNPFPEEMEAPCRNEAT
jgi:hypothetical protein